MKTLLEARPRTLAIGLATSVCTAAFVLACSDDGGPRANVDPPDSGPDVIANLPDAGEELDSGSEAGRPQRPPFDPADEPVACAGAADSCAVQLVAGRNHFCARMSDGTVRCWGDGRSGATGETVVADGGAVPAVRTIQGLAGTTQLSAGGATTCARLGDGTARCWGSNQYGQLGLDGVSPTSDMLDHPVPSEVALKELVTRIDVGPRVACAVLASGKVSCWGQNYEQQVASPAVAVSVPTELDLGSFAVTTLSIGSGTTFGVSAQGAVSWGAVNGRSGFLGGRLASVTPNLTPGTIEELHDVTSFAASATLERDEEGRLDAPPPPPPPPGGSLPHAHACAIVAGEVYCWGRSDFAALCTGLFDTERLPAHAPINGKAWPQQLAVGDELTCARMTDGSIQCCGADHRGRLGVGFSPLFVPVAAFKGHAVQVATSHRAICALLKDGSVECWGNNKYGELGQGTTDEAAHPDPVKVAF